MTITPSPRLVPTCSSPTLERAVDVSEHKEPVEDLVTSSSVAEGCHSLWQRQEVAECFENGIHVDDAGGLTGSSGRP